MSVQRRRGGEGKGEGRGEGKRGRGERGEGEGEGERGGRRGGGGEGEERDSLNPKESLQLTVIYVEQSSIRHLLHLPPTREGSQVLTVLARVRVVP